MITDPQVNQLLDPDLLPRPRFAFIPSLRSAYVPGTGRILVSKRDARHYFHRLKIGRRAGPSICVARPSSIRLVQQISSLSVDSDGVWTLSWMGSGSH